MKTLLLCILLSAQAAPGDTLSAVFWNLENFFDWRNDSTSVSDADFSSRGAKRWTRKRFETKCNAIAKTLLWAAGETGRLPDIVGVAEVENAFVLKRLLYGTLLRKLDYRIVHFDSPDRRGIDVALLYRSGILELLDAKPCHLYTDSLTILPTRDILLGRFRRRSAGEAGVAGQGEPGPEASATEKEFAVLVNHHPSKFGGAAASNERRRAATGRLRFLADSLSAIGIRHILAFGDFNDTPANPDYRALEPSLLPLYEAAYSQGEGTIRYDGRWELIDLAFASPGEGWASPMRILRPPFLQTHDTAHGGMKPLRTYSGPRYIGGVSDHCPILVRLAPP